MNIGYGSFREVDNECCPICGSDIYISKYQDDFSCIDINCPLGHGVSKIIEKIDKINTIVYMIKNNK